MKKYLFFATALAALASCTSNDFVGEDTSSTTNQSEQAAIAFGTGVNSITRADHVGADAAGLLNKKFIVGGFKGATGTSTVYDTDGTIATSGVPSTGMVYDNYQVKWVANTAGTTQSNTSDWEYVDLDLIAPSSLVNTEGVKQSIKYWDYSADQYDFIAYSTGDASVLTTGTPTSDQVLVSSINAGNAGKKASGAYTLKGYKEGLKKCYIADMVTAYKTGASMSPAQPKFQDEIQFQFRALASKVRVAIYETIPGYSVKDVKFYIDSSTGLSSTDATKKVNNATLFTTGSADKDNFYTAGTYTVYFPTIGSANISNSDYNKAHVTFSPEADGKDTKMTFGGLNYTTKEKREKTTGDIWLGRTSAQASFAGAAADNYYQIAMPNEDGTVLELRIDYTLESIDGSGEEITVHGATAFVPAIYAAWKSNYAYTYIFKISDNTNGWTSQVNTDPAGLYPITFDAIVVDSEEHTQSTITTVATPSITTYQKGHDYSAQETYKAGDIYVQVMTGTTLESDLATKGFLYTLSNADATEAEVMDAISIQEAAIANPPANITGRNGLVLTNAAASVVVTGITTIPGADGNNITVTEGTAAKITATANTYAYIYDTDTYNSVYVATEPTGWPSGYYTENTCTTPASGTFEAGTYYQPSPVIRSYMVLSSEPSDWNASGNVYYSDEACTTPINSEYANPSASYTTKPADWPTGYYTNSDCTTAATVDGFSSSTPYYRKLTCYKKYTVNNKIYGVKVIKVVSGS